MVAALADSRSPRCVALRIEAASVRLTFTICTTGSAAAVATAAQLGTLLPDASEASARLGTLSIHPLLLLAHAYLPCMHTRTSQVCTRYSTLLITQCSA